MINCFVSILNFLHQENDRSFDFDEKTGVEGSRNYQLETLFILKQPINVISLSRVQISVDRFVKFIRSKVFLIIRVVSCMHTLEKRNNETKRNERLTCAQFPSSRVKRSL